MHLATVPHGKTKAFNLLPLNNHMNKQSLKLTSYLILFFLFLSQCKPKIEKCNDKFNFIHCTDSIPVINFPLNQNHDTIYDKLKMLYNNTDSFASYFFRLPFEIDNQKGHIKIHTKIGVRKSIICGLRNNLTILINSQNQLLVKNAWSNLDTLKHILELNFKGKYSHDQDPTNHESLNIVLKWDKNASPKILQKIINTIVETHFKFVTENLLYENENFCSLKKYNITQLKEKFPLRIEFDLFQYELEPPSPFK